MRRRLPLLSLLGVVAALAPLRIRGASWEASEPFAGVRHIHRMTTLPRELDMHLLEIDLSTPGLDFRVTPSNHAAPGETVGQTTRDFLTQQGAQIAINGAYSAYVSGINMDIEGLAVSDGFIYSTFQVARLEALNISSDNVATIIQSSTGSGFAHSPQSQLYNVLGGDARLVTDGMNTANQADNSLHPRTAAGVTAAGKLLLLTVDGRNPGHSRGVSTPELANLMIQFGALNAINLDGGGSTTMVFADPSPRLVNISVGISNTPGTERIVGNNLAIFASPSVANYSEFIFADFEFGDESIFGYSLTSSGSTAGILNSSAAEAISNGDRDGSWGQRLTILDDPTQGGDAQHPEGWFVRHLSGKMGAGSATTRFSNTPRPTEGVVGFWARTNDQGVEASLAIDNTAGVTADRGLRQELIPDGQWHRYSWNLEDDDAWEGWFNGDGVIDSADFTLDSIHFFGGDSNATIWIDDVFHDTRLPLPGDFNHDRVVDAADLAQWKSAFGVSATADADADGDTDGNDFLVWQRQVSGSESLTASSINVPEPNAMAMALVYGLALPWRRRGGTGFFSQYDAEPLSFDGPCRTPFSP